MKHNTVNGLWIGDSLSPVEQLCILSFINHGHEFHLWVYGPVGNVPSNCQLKNANIIIPEEKIFTYRHKSKIGVGQGSYAGFSDIFRYKLLYETGGIWTDMDVTCLKKIDINAPYLFRYHHKLGAVGNFLCCPPKSDIMLECYKQSVESVTEENTDWILPIRILNNNIQKHGLAQYIRKISNNDSFPVVAKMLTTNKNTSQDWHIIHWMNEEFRRVNLSKLKFIRESKIGFLLNQYNIPFEEMSINEKIKYNILTSRYWYLWLNLKNLIGF